MSVGRSVGWSVCRLVGLSVGQKNVKNVKKCQKIVKKNCHKLSTMSKKMSKNVIDQLTGAAQLEMCDQAVMNWSPNGCEKEWTQSQFSSLSKLQNKGKVQNFFLKKSPWLLYRREGQRGPMITFYFFVPFVLKILGKHWACCGRHFAWCGQDLLAQDSFLKCYGLLQGEKYAKSSQKLV